MDVPTASVLKAARANAKDGEGVWRAAERSLVIEALMEGGDGKNAAKILGITERRLCYKRRKLGLGRGQSPPPTAPESAQEPE